MDEKNKFSTYVSAMHAGKQRLENEAKIKQLFIAEYEQKIDLLLQLSSNLQKTLILRGKSGVGKTTVLIKLAAQQVGSSDILLINATPEHNFGIIQNELIRFMSKTDQPESHSMVNMLEAYARRGKRVVLLIDDAAQLVTGLISALVGYAKQYTALKLIFAFTPEEYSEKSRSENIANNCHFIDLSSLDYHQCEQFIRQLIFYKKSSYTLNDITTSLIKEVYSKTQGNPRKIVKFITAKKENYFAKIAKFIVSILLITVTLMFVSLYWWNEQENEHFLPLPGLLVQQPNTLRPIQQVIEQKILVPRQVEAEDVSQNHLIQGSQVAKIKVNNEPEISKATVSKSAVVIDSDAVSINEPIIGQIDNRHWILDQRKTKYTLQLMALSVKENLLKEKKKYQMLGYKIFSIEKMDKTTKSYVLFLGQFQSYAEAKKNRQRLPKVLRNSWPRKFSVLQKDLRNSVAGIK